MTERHLPCGCWGVPTDGGHLVIASAFICPARHNQGDFVPVGPDDDPAWDVRHQRERAAAWEAGVTPTPHDPATDDWATVDEAVGLYEDATGDTQRAVAAAREALARLRARDQARTDALIEAAWSYRQKADEPGVSAQAGAACRMAADTLTRIAETT